MGAVEIFLQCSAWFSHGPIAPSAGESRRAHSSSSSSFSRLFDTHCRMCSSTSCMSFTISRLWSRVRVSFRENCPPLLHHPEMFLGARLANGAALFLSAILAAGLPLRRRLSRHDRMGDLHALLTEMGGGGLTVDDLRQETPCFPFVAALTEHKVPENKAARNVFWKRQSPSRPINLYAARWPMAAARRRSCVASARVNSPPMRPSWSMRMRSLRPINSGSSLETRTTALPVAVSWRMSS